MRRILSVFIICAICQPLFAYRGSSELINVPSAKMPKAGEIEYGAGVRFFVKDNTKLQNAGTMFFHASLSDKFQYGLTVRNDFVPLHSFQGQLYSSYDAKKNVYHYVAGGVKNVGYTVPTVKTTDPVLDYFLTYSLDIPNMDTTYHAGLAFDRSSDRQLVVVAAAEYGFFFGKTMIEWDGRALNLGIKYRLASNEYLYITVTPTPVSAKNRSPEYVSMGYTFTDNIWDQFKKMYVPRKEYDASATSTDTRLSVVEAKQQAFSDLMSTEFLSKIETSFLKDTEGEKLFSTESKSVVKGAMAHMQKGMEYYYQSKFKMAQNEYETVVALLPEYYLGYVRLGSIHYQLGEKSRAREYWQKALSYKIDNPSLKSYLEKMVASIPAPISEDTLKQEPKSADVAGNAGMTPSASELVQPVVPNLSNGNQIVSPDNKGELNEIKR